MPTPDHRTSSPRAEQNGASVLAPEAEVAAVRRGRERPAEVGRYLLVLTGLVCASASAAVWIPRGPGALPALGLFAFGILLIALGYAQHLLLRRDRSHWPDEAHVWSEGIELVLHNGEVRGALWDDPKLALDIYVQPRRGATEPDRLLVWLMDPKIPPCDLSQDGFDRVKDAVLANRLSFGERRRGSAGRERSVYSIRPSQMASGFNVPQASPERSPP